MNQHTAALLEQINNKLQQQPLIYFCKEADRATGLEDLLKNYHIACVDDSYLTQKLAGKIKVFRAQQVKTIYQTFSTLNLISSEPLKNWIKEVAPSGFYAHFFQFNGPTAIKAAELGGVVLNNDYKLNRKFEDKLSQYEFLSANKLPTPKTIIGNISEFEYHYLAENLKSQFVVQMDRAHTGLGTFFVKNEDDFLNVQKQLAGNKVKFSTLISAPTYTINGCVTRKGIFIAGLQYQITGIPLLTVGAGSTVGNDFSFANELSSEIKAKIFILTKTVGELLQKEGYKGLFGLDLVIENNTVPLIIEINARQTANIPLQTRLELKAGVTPLALINLAEFLRVDITENPPTEILPLEGSQIFLRAKNDNFRINHKLLSGVYRLQSDNSAIDWNSLQVKDTVILIDEDGDKPLVWQKDGYNISDIDQGTGGFILLIQKEGNIRNKSDEIARMQFNNKIVTGTAVSPWITEALNAIENIIK